MKSAVVNFRHRIGLVANSYRRGYDKSACGTCSIFMTSYSYCIGNRTEDPIPQFSYYYIPFCYPRNAHQQDKQDGAQCHFHL